MHIVFAQFYSHLVTPDYDELAAVLRTRGHEAWVGTPNEAGNLEWWRGEEQVAAQVRQTTASSPLARMLRPIQARLRDYQFMWRVRRFLHNEQPDIVQVNPASVHGVWLLPLSRPSSIHFVIDWRQIGEPNLGGRFGFVKRFWTSLRRQVVTRMFYEHACFLHEAGAARVLGPQWRTHASVVPLGVDRRFLEPMKGSIGEKSPDEPVRFLYIGTLSRVRRLERLIEAAAIVQAESSNFCIDLIGPNRSEDYYLNLIEKLNVQKVVRLRSPVPYHNVPETIMQYDVAFAIVPEEPADWQYHPTLKVLEYRALGIPIIATDVAPNRDVVLGDSNGVLVSNNPTSIAAAMLAFIQDRAWLAEVTAEAFRMREGRVWDQIGDIYLRQVYEIMAEPVVSTPKETISQGR